MLYCINQGAVVHSFDPKASPTIKASQALQERVSSSPSTKELSRSKFSGGVNAARDDSKDLESAGGLKDIHSGMSEVALEKESANLPLREVDPEETIPGNLAAAPVELRESEYFSTAFFILQVYMS